MNIDALIQAAEFLERRDREQEHGYASSLPMPISKNRKSKMNNKKLQGGNSRSSHNELEKNRRAHLRNCLDRLKDIVPLGADTSRHTTLGLLTKAKKFIKSLEEKDKRKHLQRAQLAKRQQGLISRFEELSSSDILAMYKRRSVSESSTSTTFSTNSSLSTGSAHSESDEIDMDDYSSGQSLKSGSVDSGVSMSMCARLTLSESDENEMY